MAYRWLASVRRSCSRPIRRADHGASVIRIDRLSSSTLDVLCRGKRSLAINPKVFSGRELLTRMIASSDVLIDPYRPGVMERLGFDPDVFLSEEKGLNKRLIYARIVGFPRTGPHKDMAGHDLNYLALSGVLSMLPGTQVPSFPLNLLADFAGGGMPCAMGILLALFARNQSGVGQLVDLNMVSGTRYLASSPLIHHHNPSTGRFPGRRGTNLLDGGSPFYNVYSCQDGLYMTVACIEPHFFDTFIHLFLDTLPESFRSTFGWNPNVQSHRNRDEWPKLRQFLAKGFMTRPRDDWSSVFHGTDGSDACCVPVLTPEEASKLDPSGPITVPTPNSDSCLLKPGQHSEEILKELGLSSVEIETLLRDGIVQQA